MMKTIKEIYYGDIVTYRNGRINYVNNPDKYKLHYNEYFQHKNFDSNMDIIKIQRYTKILCFYRLKTIYKRPEL